MNIPKVPVESIGVLSLAATQGMVLFTTLLPSRSRVYESAPTPAIVSDVRHGELVATALTLGFATMLALFTRSAIPVWVGAVTTVTMVAAYEISLVHGGHNDDTD
jgi:hypothetical protein